MRVLECQLNLPFFGLLFLLSGANCEVKIEDVSDEQAAKIIETTSYVLLFIGSDDCPKCVEALLTLELFVETADDAGLKIIKVTNSKLLQTYGVTKTPATLYFRSGYPLTVEADDIGSEDPELWMKTHQKMATKLLHDDDFEHLTQAATGATTGDWLIMFYQPSTKQLLATWESIARRMNQRINVAVVDVSANPQLLRRFSVKDSPQLYFFRFGKMYQYSQRSHDLRALLSFAEGGYRHEAGRPVPKLPSPFDELTNKVALYVKGIIDEYGYVQTLLVVLMFFAVTFGYLCSRSKHHHKAE